MSQTLENRWWISAELTTHANLHIGIGDTVPDDKRVEKGRNEKGQIEYAEVSAVAADANGKPWIPGAGLRGALRTWLEEHFKSEDEKTRLAFLFGPEAAKRELTPDDKAGALAVFGARFLDDSGVSKTTKESNYWREDRATAVETGVAIDRVFGVASDKKLYYREAVPAGVRFQLEMEVFGGEEAHIALLRAALDALGNGEILLGAESGDGKGRVNLEAPVIGRADSQQQEKWIKARLDGKDTPLKEFAVTQPVAAATPTSSQAAKPTLAITLNFDGLFCVNDPGRVIPKDDPAGRKRTENAMPRLDARGRPLLPAASFRGVLRTRMERIGRTLGLPICEGSGTACKAVHTLAEAAKLCPVCALMGAAGWASTLQLSDFTEDSGRDLGDGMPQDFVAIDRFTGGGKDGAKFQFRAFHQPILSGRLTLDTDRLAKIGHAKDSIGLLKLALRDLEEGDLRFGMGAAKGYGQVREAGFSPTEGWSAIMTAVVGNSPQSEAPKFQPETPKEFKEPPKEFKEPPKPTQEAGSNEFLNPYQFVPPPTRLPGGNAPPPEGWKNLSDAKAAKLGHAGHQCFVNQAGGEPVYSGRIICQLTAETPLFVGGLREPYQPAKDGQPERLAIAHHFKLGNQRSNGSDAESDGDLAIPASSLRGLISSMVEAATGSAMRVLDDRMLSYRKSADEALSAIGMVVEQEGKFYLLPVTMQTKMWDANREVWKDLPKGVGPYPKIPAADPPYAPLKIYFDAADGTKSYVPGNQQVRYIRLANNLSWDGKDFTDREELRYPNNNPKDKPFAIGQKGNSRSTLKFSDSMQLGPEGPANTTRCVMRIMRSSERTFPDNVHHDLLVPLPSSWEEEGDLYPIPTHVEERFNQLADERTDSQKRDDSVTDNTALPYHPIGTRRNSDTDTLKRNLNLRLKEGDLVYYRTDLHGHIDEISFSSIWRGRVEEVDAEDNKVKAATVRRFFEKVSAELLPFNKKRQFLSPAEMMFGYASDDKKNTPDEEWGGAYAGRIFPGDGLTKEKAVQGDEVTLKILDAPKPPSPSLYFRRAQDADFIAKKDLRPNDHRPNGRKFYLHQTRENTPWEATPAYADKHKKQVVRIRPVKEGAEFVFHLDFENLSAWELGALCYALRPETEFRHKLGMGKPLGLGTVRIDPLGVFLVDRPRRYGNTSEIGRYHYACWAEGAGGKFGEWQERYPREAQTSELPGSPTFDQLREKFRSGMEPNLRKALLVLGDPAYVGDTPVRYPVAQGQQDDSEQFQWFVNNDKAGHYWDRLPDGVLKGQFLEPPISGLNRLKPNKDFALKSKAKDKK